MSNRAKGIIFTCTAMVFLVTSSSRAAALLDARAMDLTAAAPAAPTVRIGTNQVALLNGQTHRFYATPTGTGPFSYSWSFQGKSLPRETNFSFKLPLVTPAEAGVYEVEVKDKNGQTARASAELMVQGEALYSQAFSGPAPEWSGGTLSFGVLRVGVEQASFVAPPIPRGQKGILTLDVILTGEWAGCEPRVGPHIFSASLPGINTLFKSTFFNSRSAGPPKIQNYPAEVLNGTNNAATGEELWQETSTKERMYRIRLLLPNSPTNQTVLFNTYNLFRGTMGWRLDHAAITLVDYQPTVIQFAEPVFSVFPGQTDCLVKLSRVGNLIDALDEEVIIENGSASEGRDYSGSRIRVHFEPGATAAEAKLPVLFNDGVATNRVAGLRLASAGGFAGANLRTNAVIAWGYETPAVTFRTNYYERGEGSGRFFVPVADKESWIARHAEAVIIGETAKEGRDVVGLKMNVGIETSRSFDVRINDDAIDNDDRTFRLHLVDPVLGVHHGPGTVARVVIRDNDTLLKAGSGVNGTLEDAFELPDGSILLSGYFENVNGIAVTNLAYIRADGTLHAMQPSGITFQVSKLLVEENGDWIALTREEIRRIRRGFILDGNYKPQVSGQVRNAILLSGDRLVIHGSFSQVNGVSWLSGVAMLNRDGGLEEGFRLPTIWSSITAIENFGADKVMVAYLGELGRIVVVDSQAKLVESFSPIDLSMGTAHTLLSLGSGLYLVRGDFGLINSLPTKGLAVIDQTGAVKRAFPDLPYVPTGVKLAGAGKALLTRYQEPSFLIDWATGVAVEYAPRDSPLGVAPRLADGTAFYWQSAGGRTVFGKLDVSGKLHPLDGTKLPNLKLAANRFVFVEGMKAWIEAGSDNAQITWKRGELEVGNEFHFQPIGLAESGVYNVYARNDHYFESSAVVVEVIKQEDVPRFERTSAQGPYFSTTAGTNIVTDIEISYDLKNWQILTSGKRATRTINVPIKFIENPEKAFLRAVVR